MNRSQRRQMARQSSKQKVRQTAQEFVQVFYKGTMLMSIPNDADIRKAIETPERIFKKLDSSQMFKALDIIEADLNEQYKKNGGYSIKDPSDMMLALVSVAYLIKSGQLQNDEMNGFLYTNAPMVA